MIVDGLVVLFGNWCIGSYVGVIGNEVCVLVSRYVEFWIDCELVFWFDCECCYYIGWFVEIVVKLVGMVGSGNFVYVLNLVVIGVG